MCSVFLSAFSDSTFEPLKALIEMKTLRDVQCSKPFSVFSVFLSVFSDSKDNPATCTSSGVDFCSEIFQYESFEWEISRSSTRMKMGTITAVGLRAP